MSDVEIGKVRDGGEILVDLATREENPYIFKIDPRDIKEILNLLAGINYQLGTLSLVTTSAVTTVRNVNYGGLMEEIEKLDKVHKEYKQFLDKTFGEGYER